MAKPIEEILAVWRALDGNSAGDGWKSIPVTSSCSSSLTAARHFPSNMESLLVGFAGAVLAQGEKLPEATGFAVQRLQAEQGDKTRLWLALSRKESGNQDLFSAMVADVVHTLDSDESGGGNRQLQLFLGRLRAWQDFMRKGAVPLGPEAEVGLVGELCFLDLLLERDVAPLAALEAWLGPTDAPQDFVLGTGAVEVKSTIATTGFPAKIGSLEQLDDSLLSPIFVAAQRLALSQTGKNLSEWTGQILAKLGKENSARFFFLQRLFAAGYSHEHAGHYTRRFACIGTRLIRVDADFPRLVPGNVPTGVRKAAYVVDLDKVGNDELTINDVLKTVGAD